MSTPLPVTRSLRLRLPLLISTIIVVVLGLFLWTTNRALERTLVQAGSDRARAAADQVASLLSQSTARSVTEARRIAGDAAVRQYLDAPSPERADAARLALAPLATASQPAVELWNAAGERLLDVAAPPARDAKPAPVLPASPLPSRSGLTPFHLNHGAVLYELAAEVDAPSPPATAAPRRLGWIILPRAITAGQSTDAINRLVGSGALIAVGNRGGGVWSNLDKPMPAPPVDTTHAGVAEYSGPTGQPTLGAVSLVAGSPWAVSIEFPRQAVLTPARALLTRMLALAVLFVLVAAVLVSVLTARITTPLHALTHASEAIAAGEFSRRVKADRGDEIGRLGAAFNTMTEYVDRDHRELEARVRERTAGLQDAIAELEAFSYSVSHDLRAPLRHVVGFASLLEQSSAAALGEQERRHLATIVAAANRMGRLIDDLLAFSRISRTPLTTGRVDLNQLVRDARHEVSNDGAADKVAWRVGDLPEVKGDSSLLRLALINVLSNAVKYSSKRERPEIDIGALPPDDSRNVVVYVRDNGVGFDMEYAHNLFGVFQRLHTQEEFEGTGIGLANVQRVIQRHGGRAWAEGRVGSGATFFLSLPQGDAG
jgi:signal transduction histidine kinase